jgi:hypothetical protein
MSATPSPSEHVYAFQLARKGGAWLGAARSWMQRRFRNGESVTWGSNDLLTGAPVTVADIEEVAAEAAAAALNERNKGRFAEQPTVLALCESGHIVPRPGQLYRYEVRPGCEKCAELAAAYTEKK